MGRTQIYLVALRHMGIDQLGQPQLQSRLGMGIALLGLEQLELEILITVGIIHPTTVPRGDGTGVGTITGDGTTIGAGVVRVTTRLTGVAAATTTLRGTSCTANRVTAVTALRPDIIRTPAPVQVTAAEATGAAEAPRPLPRAIVLRARIRQPAEELPTAEDRRVPQRAA